MKNLQAVASEKTELIVPLKKLDEVIGMLACGHADKAREELLTLKRTAPECECWKHGHG